MSWKNDTSRTGYNLEELYFEKLNRELINKIKAEQGSGGKDTKSEGQMADVIPFRAREKDSGRKAA